jgi:HPt (histidine-containing phosphotransfer) domain-containing protein
VYEATRAIRQTTSAEALPIVAITAHALKEEVERCLAAGMNGHISKPINPDELYASLAELIRPNAASKRAQQQSASAPKADEYLLPAHLPGISLNAVMKRINGNTSLLRTLLVDFHTQNTSTVAEIRSAIATGNSEQILALAHALKGVAGNIGAEELAATAMAFENAVKEGSVSADSPLLDVLEQKLAEVFEAALSLKQTESEIAKPNLCKAAVQVDMNMFEREVKELYHMLSLNKISSIDKFNRLKTLCPDQNRCKELEKQIADFDFKGAKLTLANLAKNVGVIIEMLC